MTREEIAKMLLQEPSDLKHYGVLGMKWGVRRYQNPDGSLTAEGRAKYGSKTNPYSIKQYTRDREVYGPRGARRINRKMVRGSHNISGARSTEKTKRDKVLGTNKYYRLAGKTGGGILGGVLGSMAPKLVDKHITSKDVVRKQIFELAGQRGVRTMDRIVRDPRTRAAATAGGAAIGNLAGGDLVVGARMSVHGYKRKR